MLELRPAVIFAGLMALCSLTAQAELVPTSSPTSGDFILLNAARPASIFIEPSEDHAVVRAADDLVADFESVGGNKSAMLVKPEDGCVIIGTLGRSKIIDALASAGKLDTNGVAGGWESYLLQIVKDPLPGVKQALVIAGSDRRGAIFGIYALSEMIGVSPWHWWADVPVQRQKTLALHGDAHKQGPPAVKYRGIFINDEDWGLEPWASKTFEPEVGNIGPKTYGRIFELLLRLRANCIWPGMHPTTTPFHQLPGNAATADAYGIVVGSSHAEPMLRNNGGEWKAPNEQFNYLINRDGVLAYWEQRVKERTNGESLFTIGMRGIHDSPIVGPKTQKERIATLETIFADQRGLLAKYLGHGSATNVGQIFCPYKEVLDDYNAGLRVPDDVPIVWPDDNFGYIRRFATPAERARSGGLGVYYHASYSGMPQSWLWIDTLPSALMWSEMTRAYEQGANALWIVNVGDIKNTERSMEFFLDLAWHVDRTDVNSPARFLRETAARDFGPAYAVAVADILSRLYTINFARKTEHLQWHLSMTPYQPTELNEAEIRERLKSCADLLRDSDALVEQLPAVARDAYFQLVGYPVGITAAANERYFRAELARADVARGRSPDANKAAAQAGEKRVDELTAHYNNEIAGGKWRNIVSENGYSPDAWPRFQRDTKTARPEPTTNNVCPPAPPVAERGAMLRAPSDARSGDFVERNKVISIHAGHFTGRNDLSSGAGWRSVPGLGRTGLAVTVLPSTAAITSNAAPRLEYRFHVATGGAATVRVRLLPTFPLVSGQGLRLALAIDDGAPLSLAVTTGFDTRNSNTALTDWQSRVMANATEATLKLPQPLKPGWHTLHLVAVDAGVVVDKIVLDFGGFHPSYDGPAETRLP